MLEAGLVSGNRYLELKKQYAKYFEIITMLKSRTKITANHEAIAKAEKDHGFFPDQQ